MLWIFVFWGAMGKICLPHQYTLASLANEVVGIFDLFSPLANFPKFARRGRISKNSNVDPSFGRTNRIRYSATTSGSVKFRLNEFGSSGFRRIERLKIVSGTNVDLRMLRTKLINWNLLYIQPRSWENLLKFVFDLIQLVGPNRRVLDVLSSTSDPTLRRS